MKQTQIKITNRLMPNPPEIFTRVELKHLLQKYMEMPKSKKNNMNSAVSN